MHEDLSEKAVLCILKFILSWKLGPGRVVLSQVPTRTTVHSRHATAMLALAGENGMQLQCATVHIIFNILRQT
jgi:hypothetical protein